MSESLLNKQIGERDLQRMRNLITKKYGDKTQTQVGYTKQQEERVEGDVWEENGKNWTIKNGIKMTVSKLDIVKKMMQIPLMCPNCNTAMKNKQLDNKMYSIHKMCFDCVIKFETRLRYEGKYEEYVAQMMQGGMRSFADELENDLQQILDDMSAKDTIITEEGEEETWKGGKTDINKIREELLGYIKQLRA